MLENVLGVSRKMFVREFAGEPHTLICQTMDPGMCGSSAVTDDAGLVGLTLPLIWCDDYL